ncbi:hypothetical protein K470DRAFT_270747 [Piedraia hortae CBS 480.64]|uniref:Uncharacterized protein n=1 Tax=Piedraia hortae CBS 480.64 TaxID=1314780 RepID=A0A6A7BYS0_9PEZI|nr:hypothetical protein K470DRAFT_270747 [Piedraia hortae CBS 480.64]
MPAKIPLKRRRRNGLLPSVDTPAVEAYVLPPTSLLQAIGARWLDKFKRTIHGLRMISRNGVFLPPFGTSNVSEAYVLPPATSLQAINWCFLASLSTTMALSHLHWNICCGLARPIPMHGTEQWPVSTPALGIDNGLAGKRGRAGVKIPSLLEDAIDRGACPPASALAISTAARVRLIEIAGRHG